MSLIRQMEKLRQTTENTAARFQVAQATEHMDDTDSWVELAPPSRGSLCSSVDALLLIEAQHNSNQSSNKGTSHHSPKSLSSPNVELASLEAVKARLVKDVLPPGKNTDWIWDWSSRPEALAPRDSMRLRHPGGTSSLTTPPNSPAPELATGYGLSLRHSECMRSVFLRLDVLLGLVVSNLFSILIGAAIGFCICRKVHKNDNEF